uniref:Disease resistance R13L4/SHOC-2-like LRR domain-containing protein n=1 Tax=Leersia perrieri TaxID=77586 RepID=A0A0D9W6K7_9ORYZ
MARRPSPSLSCGHSITPTFAHNLFLRNAVAERRGGIRSGRRRMEMLRVTFLASSEEAFSMSHMPIFLLLIIMLVNRSIDKDVFEPLVMRISRIEQRFFRSVGSYETGDKGLLMQEFPEKIKWELQHLEELFEHIKEDKEEVYRGIRSVNLAISEWQRRLAVAYKKASIVPRPFEGMKWAVEHYEMWAELEDDDIIGSDDEILDFDENELFKSLRYRKTAQGGEEACLLESIKSGTQCIKNVLATIRSRKEADNRSWCIVEQIFSPLLKLLKTIDHLVSEAIARNNKSENYKILVKIDAEVNCLQDALDLIDRNKNEVDEYFRLMEDLILPLLTCLKATYNDRSEALSFLDSVKNGVNNLEGVLHKIKRKQLDGNDNFHIVEAAFSPLLTCLCTYRCISLEALAHEDKSAAFVLLDNIKDELSQLKDVLHMVQEKENGIYNNFDAIEEHIDEIYVGPMNVEGSLKPIHIGGLRDKLQLIHEEIANIRGKVNDSFKVQEASSHVVAAAHEASSSHQFLASETFCINMESAQIWQLKGIIDEQETRLRHCLLSLSVFPVDAIIKKRLLIHWWIGEGFVTSVSEGKSFFNKFMLSDGFIKPIKKCHCDKVHWCKVQPWIRGLLIEAAKSKAFVELSSDGSSRNDFTRTRRACLHAGKVLSTFHPDVLTIYNIKQQYIELDKTWFSKKTCLSTLQLGQWQDTNYDPRAHHIEINNSKFLKQVSSCRQLKYLSLRGISRIDALPPSIGKLSRLVILDLKACHNLEDLPKEIVKLVKLEYLDVSDCYLLSSIPKGLGKLFQLEVLKGFVLSNAKSKDPCHLNELAMLKKLRKLSIRIGYNIDSSQFANFGEFCALQSLTLTWGAHGSSASHVAAPAMPCVLPLGLEKLELRCFPLAELPHWVSPEKLRNLKKLYIKGGYISGLGDMNCWEVTILRLRFLKHMNYAWTALNDSFRKLDVLEVYECENLLPWPYCEKGLWRKEPNGTLLC